MWFGDVRCEVYLSAGSPQLDELARLCLGQVGRPGDPESPGCILKKELRIAGVTIEVGNHGLQVHRVALTGLFGREPAHLFYLRENRQR
jgi:hypothetical protein